MCLKVSSVPSLQLDLPSYYQDAWAYKIDIQNDMVYHTICVPQYICAWFQIVETEG